MNYSSISLLSVFSKGFENLMFDRMISNCQHRFREEFRSTETAAFSSTEYVYENLDKRLDFAGLLVALRNFKENKLYNWISRCLCSIY